MNPASGIPPLAGVTVWLSGAVPEPESWAGRPLDVEVLDFVALLTALVLKQGGSILHGAHPSFTAVLMEQARRAKDAGLGRDRVTLAVSKFWEKETVADICEWKPFCRVIETEVGRENNEPSRDPSLDILRSRMAKEAHSFVAVGGKWWSEQPGRAGVPREFDLARERGVPCFLVGGFGGKSAGYLRDHPRALENLNNGLSIEENRQLAMCEDPGLVTGAVVAQLCALFSRAEKDASAIPAHALYVELATRITTQRLHYRSGDEETAARSLASLFDTTRKLMTANPDARTFHEIALALLNDTVRPYTARWHGWMTKDGEKTDKDGKPILKLRDEWVRRKFREELRELQPRLAGFQKALQALSLGRHPDPRWLRVEQEGAMREQLAAECRGGQSGAALGTDLPLSLRSQVTLRAAAKTGRDDATEIAKKIGLAEKRSILRRRAQLAVESRARQLADEESLKPEPRVANATGLALSGGGIRSATFCLGVVQTLHRRGLFAEFDYLSTVSGGGYLGSFLSCHLGADPEQLKKAEEAVAKDRKSELGTCTTPRYDATDDTVSPQTRLDELFGQSSSAKAGDNAVPAIAETPALRHLRNNSRYLLGGGAWGLLRMAQVFFGGFFSSLLILLTLPLAAAWLLLIVKVPTLLVVIALWVVAALWLLVPLAQRCAHGTPSESPPAKLRDAVQSLALFAVLTAALLAALHYAPALVLSYKHWGNQLGESIRSLIKWKPPEFLTGLLAAIVPAVFGALVRRKDGSTRSWAQNFFYLTTPAFFLFAFLIFASGLGVGEDNLPPLLWPAIASAALFVWAWFFLNINAFAPHGYYRDRLCECYLTVQRKVGCDKTKIVSVPRVPLTGLGARVAAPYHLINATLNAEASKDTELRGRNGDFFIFSRHYCGSPLSGYIATEDLERIDPHVDLGTAMAISGAAASTNMGWQTVRRLRFLMTLFNVRLGYWLPRLGTKPWPRPIEAPGPLYLFREMLGRVHEKGRFINISDGGHIENLAVYELLRRQCKFIVAVDAGMEPKMECADLMRLQRYAAIDLGIGMHFDPTDLTLLPTTYSRAYAVLVKIDYAPEQTRPHAETSDQLGWMLYLKLAVTGTEPRYVLDYRRQNPAFPHQTTADQFYDEAQFEAYRALGEFAAESLFREEIVGTSMPTDLRAWFQKLADSLLPDNDEAFCKGPESVPAPNP